MFKVLVIFIWAFLCKYNIQPGGRAVWAMPDADSTAGREAVWTWLCDSCPLGLPAVESVRLDNYIS